MNNSDVSVVEEVEHCEPECLTYDYSQTPQQNIVFDSELLLAKMIWTKFFKWALVWLISVDEIYNHKMN